MAKVTIEFDSVEDAEELRITMSAVGWYAVVHELDQKLRAMAKYEGFEYASDVREMLHEIMNENEVSL